jgi:hypothetical protein
VRQALNSNPVVQAVVLGILVIVVAFLLLTRVMNSDDGAAEEPATATSSAVPAATEAVPASPETTAAPEAVAPGTESGSVPAVGAGPGREGFVAGPGLPKAVASAYDDGEAVVVLITREKGIDDKRLEAIVKAIEARPDTAVFETRAAGIADYSRITQGVDVDRTPALVVIQPKRLADGGLPTATVSYGFRGPDSAEQAVRDALYEGRDNIPYYPE